MAKIIKFLDLARKSRKFRHENAEVFNRVTSRGNFILGPELGQFEQMFGGYLGTRNVIGVGNGLDALKISLMALGIGPGDEVITTPLSAVATTLAIFEVGATPVFVDTDAKGLMRADQITAEITNKTKAVIPVHLYGQPCEIKTIKAICDENKLELIEDACQAHGSTYEGKKLGTFGKLGCFSFYPTKNMGCLGDGGAIVTDDDQLANACRMIRDYGQSSKYVHMVKGVNSRLDELQSAFLKEELLRLDKEITHRRKIADIYYSKLKLMTPIIILTDKLIDSNFHLFAVWTNQRENLQKHLKDNGIETAVHYPVIIPDQPFMHDNSRGFLPQSTDVAAGTLSLPCNSFVSEEEANYVCDAIINFYSPYS